MKRIKITRQTEEISFQTFDNLKVWRIVSGSIIYEKKEEIREMLEMDYDYDLLWVNF